MKNENYEKQKSKFQLHMLYVDCNTAKGKRMASKKLREALDEKSARTRKARKILLFLPDLTEHRGHDISKVN